MLFRCLLLTVLLNCPREPVWAADRPPAPSRASHQWVFAPTNPDGVASELPRSPLADIVVNGEVRFSDPAQAQARCPTDVVVWVPFWRNRYHPVRYRDGRGWPGAFMCEADASIEGDWP